MKIEFISLQEVDKTALIALMNNPGVRRQMPLLQGVFTEDDCDRFLAAKERLWKEHGFGPWGFMIEGAFAGWGGVQCEDGEADLALVLHPDFWGTGKTLYKKIIDKAFNELGLDSVQVLFPPTRTRIKGLLQLGFVRDKEVSIGEETFIRFVLNKPE